MNIFLVFKAVLLFRIQQRELFRDGNNRRVEVIVKSNLLLRVHIVTCTKY